MNAPLRVAVTGAGGRMGQAVLRLVAADPAWQLVGAIDHGGSSALGRDAGELVGAGTLGVEVSADVSSSLLGAHVVIDFSVIEAVAPLARHCARQKVALVSGTTNLPPEVLAALDETAKTVPVLWSPNMSVGVQVLADLVKAAVKALGPGFDVEIVETHHRKKVDAPSGTAKRLFEAVAEAREARAVHGREGQPGARFDDEVGVLALRGGDVIGDHSVHLLGMGERIELTHRATSRELFARGALRAARAIALREPGRYGMADVAAAGI